MIRKLPFMLIALCFLLSCGGDDPLDIKPEDDIKPEQPEKPEDIMCIQLSDTILSLKIGEKKQLTYTVKPEYSGQVIWNSNNEQVVSVSNEGVVTGGAVGEAKVTLSLKQFPSVFAICKIEVSTIELESITLSETEVVKTIGDSIQLSVQYFPEDAINKEIEWKSSDENIASVNEKGLVFFNQIGECTITATALDGKHTATCQITVLPVIIENISFKTNYFEIAEDETFSLIEYLSIFPENANKEDLIWVSNNTNVCSVDEKGNVYGYNIGETTVSVYTPDRKLQTTCDVRIVSDEVILNNISAWIEGIEKDIYGNMPDNPSGHCVINNNNVNKITVNKITTYGIKMYTEWVKNETRNWNNTILENDNYSFPVQFASWMKPYAFALVEFTHGDKKFSIQVYVP